MTLLEKLKQTDIFGPRALLGFYLLFVLIAGVSFFTGLPMRKPSMLGFAVIVLSLPFYLVGVKLSERIYKKKVPYVVQWVILSFIILFYASLLTILFKMPAVKGLVIWIPGLVVVCFVFRKLYEILKEWAGWLCILTGVALLGLSFLGIQGIPLFDFGLKNSINKLVIFGFSVFFFTVGYSMVLNETRQKSHFFLIVLGAVLLFSLTMFRTFIIFVLLIGVIIAYNKKFLDNKKVIAPLLIAALLILLIGYVTAPLLSPGRLFLYRAGTTHLVFDELCHESYPFGMLHGTAFFRENLRTYVAELQGASTNITYTLLGASVIDFGVPGAFAWMLFLGFVIGLACKSRKEKPLNVLYPLVFAMSLVWIEVGVDPFSLGFILLFLLSYSIVNARK